jgi:hypothetical protein
METFPWEPPDGASGASSSEFGAQVGLETTGRNFFGRLCLSFQEIGVVCGGVVIRVLLWEQVGGHGWEIPGREGDAHGAAASPGAGLEGEVAGCQEVHLDLGLGDITRYSSYSKLWRTL